MRTTDDLDYDAERGAIAEGLARIESVVAERDRLREVNRDLLEALRGLLHEMDDEDMRHLVHYAALDAARAAITKAEGTT